MEKIILSLGGSIMVPKKVDPGFITNFKDLILSLTDSYQFAIITGGGKVAREYIKAGTDLGFTNDENDWLGIFTTRLNANLLRIAFSESAEPKILTDPNSIKSFEKPVLLGGGFTPGNSTDLVAVLLAKSLGAKKVLNLSNIDYVFDKDPRLHKDAKRFEKLSWREYLNIIGEDWTAGKSTPFDPVASKTAMQNNISVCVLNGKDLANVKSCILGKQFQGTILQE